MIGLTGNIASGKSTVRRMLEELGARVVDADLLAHYVMRPGKPAWRAIAAEFGPGVVRADGSIDRGALGAIVFSDPAKLARLEK
ncbi:MAG: dephospho-CoA kinase, partial [Rudaea sp.]